MQIATPLRYITTIVGIQLAFYILRRFGWLRTAKEFEYKIRSEYEKKGLHKVGRHYRGYGRLGRRTLRKIFKNVRNVNKNSNTKRIK